MKLYGIDIFCDNVPKHDPAFIPLNKFNEEFLKTARKPVDIAVERKDGQISTFCTCIHGTPEMREADIYYIDRFVKNVLWMKGGFRVYISGCDFIFDSIKKAYFPDGSRSFDYAFMSRVYEQQMEILNVSGIPASNETSHAMGHHLKGCRIGFDAGGSDRKVSAVIDGQSVYSEEVVWYPKTNADPDYHFREIVSAFRTASAYLPRVDGIGVSAAGVYVENRTMVASLFMNVPEHLFHSKVKDIFLLAGREIGEMPVVVCNDGDVTALAGAMSLDTNNVLGIAMGTSEAVGYVDKKGNITGWLNELAFAPVDASPGAMKDEWSGDIGCGVKYFSQDSIIKLALAAHIDFDKAETPAEKLGIVQKLVEQDDPRSIEVFESLGVYLGHTLPLYYSMYGFSKVLLLGRVMGGKGGNIILDTAHRVLTEEYPNVAAMISVSLPDEKSRRIGQSVAAASLPDIFGGTHAD